jgi:hypothetical protein
VSQVAGITGVNHQTLLQKTFLFLKMKAFEELLFMGIQQFWNQIRSAQSDLWDSFSWGSFTYFYGYYPWNALKCFEFCILLSILWWTWISMLEKCAFMYNFAYSFWRV